MNRRDDSMRRSMLEELPAPPPGRTGWPWTESSAALDPVSPDGSPWPRITVITPSFNQARYLEATIRSVLLQGYPNLEYFVLDGGSDDGSVEIVRRYERWLTHWESGPDGGQSAAINRGLRRGTGAFATWINSDDMLERNALVSHARRAGFDPELVYVGDCLYIDEHDRPQFAHRARVRTLEDLLRVRSVWRGQPSGHIVQPETLFPREFALHVGALDPDNHRTMDYELWGKLLLAGARFEYTKIPFARFRVHGNQKTSQGWATTRSLLATARALLREAPDMPARIKAEIAAELDAHEREYWRATGRLARVGLPERVVAPIRHVHQRVRRLVSGMRGL